MNVNDGICVGIDLCADYSQLSYCKLNNEEPVSVEFYTNTSKSNLFTPTVVSKTIGMEQWYAGDEADTSGKLGEAVLVKDLLRKVVDKNPVQVDDVTIMPLDLLNIFFGYLLQAAKADADCDNILMVSVTLRDYNISVLKAVVKSLENLGIERDRIITSSHDESYIYYTINQSEDLWKNDVFLFDYDDMGLVTKRFYIAPGSGQRIVMVHSEDYTEEVSAKLIENTASGEYLDRRLLEIATKLFEKKNISTVYLTGKYFSDEIDMPDFIKFICERRRVFAGNNLYCKGACFQARQAVTDCGPKDMLLACRERITTGIEMKISDHGKDKILKMVKPGVNWFGADCSYEFIVDNIDEIEIFLSPVDSMEKQVVKVSLADFPDRKNKTMRIAISFSFTSDSRCYMMVKDMGFGEFFASSGMVINEELLL